MHSSRSAYTSAVPSGPTSAALPKLVTCNGHLYIAVSPELLANYPPASPRQQVGLPIPDNHGNIDYVLVPCPQIKREVGSMPSNTLCYVPVNDVISALGQLVPKATTPKKTKNPCGTCRSAKRKCSGEKPKCQSCARSGKPCFYEDRSKTSHGAYNPGLISGTTSNHSLSLDYSSAGDYPPSNVAPPYSPPAGGSYTHAAQASSLFMMGHNEWSTSNMANPGYPPSMMGHNEWSTSNMANPAHQTTSMLFGSTQGSSANISRRA